MPSTVFAAPILPGKTDAWKAAIAEISGPRREEYIQARRNIGITKEVVCLQQTPQGDMVCVYIEARDASHVLDDMISATDPFHTWFKQAVLAEVHGISASGPLPPANEAMLDLF